MLAETPIIGFIPVRDLDAAEAFYAGKLGLTVRGRDGFALVLEAAAGATIRCVVTRSEPLPFTIFGWEVPEIHAAVRDLVAAGVSPSIFPHFQQDQEGVWTAPDGSRVAWFQDPFGNLLSVSQHPGKA